MREFKHKIKLLWLKRKWVIQSVFNTKEFKTARFVLNLEKKAIASYHEAVRSGDAKEIARAEGRLSVFEKLKEELEK